MTIKITDATRVAMCEYNMLVNFRGTPLFINTLMKITTNDLYLWNKVRHVHLYLDYFLYPCLNYGKLDKSKVG